MKIINMLKLSSTLLICWQLIACSATPELEPDAEEPTWPLAEGEMDHSLSAQYSDPFEGFNRRMYYFNAKADEYVLLPLVDGYQAITPDPVEESVSNFFSNIGEIPTFINTVLQLKPGPALETFGRFAVNTTVGIAGLFDPATHIGLHKQNEDFGQTLGHYGVGPGPYLVLPLLGPSNLRDATGGLVDMVIYQEVLDELQMKDEEELFLNFLRTIDTRKNNSFRYYGSGSAFEYGRMRLLYNKYREIQIAR